MATPPHGQSNETESFRSETSLVFSGSHRFRDAVGNFGSNIGNGCGSFASNPEIPQRDMCLIGVMGFKSCQSIVGSEQTYRMGWHGYLCFHAHEVDPNTKQWSWAWSMAVLNKIFKFS